MHILVIGSGLMGPAAAYNAMSDPAVTTVTLADMDSAQLEAARARLAAFPAGRRCAPSSWICATRSRRPPSWRRRTPWSRRFPPRLSRWACAPPPRPAPRGSI